MAKITQQRFPDPPQEYNPSSFFELVRLLEQLVTQLNTSYTNDTAQESTRRAVFLSKGGD